MKKIINTFVILLLLGIGAFLYFFYTKFNPIEDKKSAVVLCYTDKGLSTDTIDNLQSEGYKIREVYGGIYADGLFCEFLD